MMRTFLCLFIAAVLSACAGKNVREKETRDATPVDSASVIEVKYATEFTVRDSADVRLVCIANNDRFALVRSDDVKTPDNYIKVRVPIRRTICMTALQLSNFTALDAHDVVRGITGTKNLFNEDINQRVTDGRIVKIGMEGEFDTELILAANPGERGVCRH